MSSAVASGSASALSAEATATIRAPARAIAAKSSRRIPPIATTGVARATATTAAMPGRADRLAGVGLRGRPGVRSDAEVVGIERTKAGHFLRRPARNAEHALAEARAQVGTEEREVLRADVESVGLPRRVEIIVDDERAVRASVSRWSRRTRSRSTPAFARYCTRRMPPRSSARVARAGSRTKAASTMAYIPRSLRDERGETTARARACW